MFAAELEAALGDSRTLTDLAADVENDARIAGCRKLLVAAAWADAHSAVDHPDGGLLVERLVPIGPVGCPAVAEFAAQGLVGPFDASTPSVRSWMADALTIRHRLPRLWERVVAGDVHHWKARQIATLTAHLSLAAAADVDAHTTPWVEQLPWPTFLKALDATMLQVDESTYRERERLAAAKREVRATPSEAGLRTLIARGEAGDVTMMMALYQRVAECLAEEGDEDPLAGADVEGDRDHREPCPTDRSPCPARRRPRSAPRTVGEGRRPPGRCDRPVGRRPPTSGLGERRARQLPPAWDGRGGVVGLSRFRRSA